MGQVETDRGFERSGGHYRRRMDWKARLEPSWLYVIVGVFVGFVIALAVFVCFVLVGFAHMGGR